MARRWRALPGALVVLAAACLTACGAGAGSPSSDARLLVTADFGNRVLVRDDAPKVRGADTVMRLVQRNAKVTTRYGGGFVQSIDGVAGGQRGGRPVDWFFYVDGVALRPRRRPGPRGRRRRRVVGPPRLGVGTGERLRRGRVVPGAVHVRRGTRVHPGDRARVRDDATGPHARGRARRVGRAVGARPRRRPRRARRDRRRDPRHPRRAPAAPGPRGQRRLRAPGPRRERDRPARPAGTPRPRRRRRAPGSSPRRAPRARLRSGPSPAPTTQGSGRPRAR